MINENHPNTTTAQAMNEDLLALYESRLPEVNEQIAQCIEQCGWLPEEVSKLFFMKVDEEYLNAPKKILFVGRETFGWDKYDKLDKSGDLMNFYENVASNGKHYNSPFWWFRQQFSQKFDIDESKFMKATLWTNLSKIDVAKGRPPGKAFDHLMQNFISVLTAEIVIVKPDIVLILTKDGYYTWHLNYYRWLRNDSFNDYNETNELERETVLGRKIERLIAPNRLPEHTYQICHPNALRRRAGGYTIHANELIDALAARINL